MTCPHFRMMITVRNLIFSCLLFAGCQQDELGVNPEIGEFDAEPSATRIQPGLVDEASGIADSRAIPGTLWVQEDSGNPPQLTLLGYTGELVKRVPVANAVNRDWEDMALAAGPVPGIDYIYIADIGDNNMQYENYWIYRFPEPKGNTTQVLDAEKISFKYPDGSHDAEAVLVDAQKKDIYIITKRDAQAGIYKLAYPQSTTSINNATAEGKLEYTGVTSGAISPSGKEIIIKTYTHIYLYKRSGNEPVSSTLKRKPVIVPYNMEPQGEAVGFRNDNTGFFTLSERGMAPAVSLRYYKRK
jgi:hypothetical protein